MRYKIQTADRYNRRDHGGLRMFSFTLFLVNRHLPVCPVDIERRVLVLITKTVDEIVYARNGVRTQDGNFVQLFRNLHRID